MPPGRAPRPPRCASPPRSRRSRRGGRSCASPAPLSSSSSPRPGSRGRRRGSPRSPAGDTFVGTRLVGLSTSLPELVASLAAVRLGAFDLAVGNLFGSNAINMVLLLPLDLAQPRSLFAALDPTHAISALFSIVLMSLGLAAVVYRAERRFAMIEPDSLLILVAYAAAVGVTYTYAAR